MKLSPTAALTAAVILGIAALIASIALGLPFFAAAAAYLVLLSSYSAFLKHIVILDVLTVAAGFTLRAAAGAAAIFVPISHWLLVCTMLLALFIALSKRRHELTLLNETATHHRPILGDYTPYLLDQMISVVTASTLIAYAFYTISPETTAEVRHRSAQPDDPVPALRNFSLPLSGAPARPRRQPGRATHERPAASELRRTLGTLGDPHHLPVILKECPTRESPFCEPDPKPFSGTITGF